jgi:hypothetical protein
MHTFTACTRRLLILLVVLTALVVPVAPVPAVRAQQPTPTPGPAGPEWPGWALRVTFPKDPATGLQAPKVIYTAYTYTVTPTVQVTGVITEDISADCSQNGLGYDGVSAAIFDGSSAFIACAVPAWRELLFQLDPTVPGANPNKDTLTCSANSPASGAAKVVVDPGSRDNPLIDASELGIALALPASGTQARTRLNVYPNNYGSPLWNINTGGNRVVMGSDGPTMVALDNYFNWMPYLHPSWKPWFAANIKGFEIGHKDEPSMNTWQGPAGDFRLRTTAATVYIGRNVAGSSYFKGRVTEALIDPPCSSK